MFYINKHFLTLKIFVMKKNYFNLRQPTATYGNLRKISNNYNLFIAISI